MAPSLRCGLKSCRKSFPSFKKVYEHMKAHADRGQTAAGLTCQMCYQTFSRKDGMVAHRKANSCKPWVDQLSNPGQPVKKTPRPKPHGCTEDPENCDRAFAEERELRTHINNDHKGIFMTCSICSAQLRGPPNAMKRHLDHHIQPFECPEADCDERFADKGMLANHAFIMHDGPDLYCQHHSSYLPTQEALDLHVSQSPGICRLNGRNRDLLKLRNQQDGKQEDEFEHDLEGSTDIDQELSLAVYARAQTDLILAQHNYKKWLDVTLEINQSGFTEAVRRVINARNQSYFARFLGGDLSEYRSKALVGQAEILVLTDTSTCENCDAILSVQTSFARAGQLQDTPGSVELVFYFTGQCVFHEFAYRKRPNGLEGVKYSTAGSGYLIAKEIQEAGLDKVDLYAALRKNLLPGGLQVIAKLHRLGLVLYADTEFATGLFLTHICLRKSDGTKLLDCIVDYGMNFDQMKDAMVPDDIHDLHKSRALFMINKYYGPDIDARVKNTPRLTPHQIILELRRLKVRDYTMVEFSNGAADYKWLNWLCEREKADAQLALPPATKAVTVMYDIWRQFGTTSGKLHLLFAVLFPEHQLVKTHHVACIDSLKLWKVCDLIFSAKDPKQTKLAFPVATRP